MSFTVIIWSCRRGGTNVPRGKSRTLLYSVLLQGCVNRVITKKKRSFLKFIISANSGPTISQYASYQIWQNRGLRMRRECRERFPCHQLQRKPLVSDPGISHGTSVTRVLWCLSGSLTHVARKTFPEFPVHAPQFYVSGKRPIRRCIAHNKTKYYCGDALYTIPWLFKWHTWWN